MDTIVIGVLAVTVVVVLAVIRSSRREEKYKRRQASGQTDVEEPKKRSMWSWFRWSDVYQKYTAKSAPRFDDEAVAWCATLVEMPVSEFSAILNEVSWHYTTFWVRKRSGGYRVISAPDAKLNRIQQIVYHRILSAVNVHPAAVGFRPNLSVVDNARPHLGAEYVLKTDIHHFFDSIHRRRICKCFEQIGYPKHISKVLGELCCFRGKLPQGAPTSPALSNVFSSDMDRKLAALADEYGLVYSRYADDMTFSGNDFSKEQVLPRIQTIIAEERLVLNAKKTRFMTKHHRKIITGISISSGTKLTIPKARKREIRKNVYFILTKGLDEHQRHIGSTDPVYLKRLIGQLCYWHSVEPDNQYVSDSIAALKRLAYV